MKAILISVDPKWSCKELNGIKPLEIRTGLRLHNAVQRLIKEQGIAPMLIYVTKSRKNILHRNCAGIWWLEDKAFQKKNKRLGIEQQPIYNGKVVARFNATAEEITPRFTKNHKGVWYITENKNFDELCIESCLCSYQLNDYLQCKKGTAIHITKLEIFDKPKELSEFYKLGAWKVYEEQLDSSYMKRTEQEIMKSLGQTLTNAPQSWYYIEV